MDLVDMTKLYVVATPIGNLADITLRATQVLRDVHLIAAEDTRKAHRLLVHYDIDTPVTSYFVGNEQVKTTEVLAALQQGDVALISEAGTPGVSDPGYPLIRAAIEQGIEVVPIPGPSALIAALVVSGLPSDRFMFVGFLPRKAPQSILGSLAQLDATLIFYEAPHRLAQTLRLMHEAFGDREIALCRELTKRFEEVWRGDLAEALVWISDHPPRGEFTLVVGGAPAESAMWTEAQVRDALRTRLAEGLPRSQAARDVAARSGWRRRSVYDLDVESG
jgi:16S rRNA (cytidine1402-2'-O)-methyltransferase